MNKGKKISKTKKAVKCFKIWDAAREDKTEEYRQCKEVRYWFVSNKNKDSEMVISFYNPENPVFLKQWQTKKGYWYVTSDRGSSKTHYIHRLQADAYGIYKYGKAKKHKNFNGLDVHHATADKQNVPELLEGLEEETHNALFNKNNVPDLTGSKAKDFKYMETISRVTEENTPDQKVVVFSGAGIKDGAETKDLEQLIYADDFPDVEITVNRALEQLSNLHGNYILYEPEADSDRKKFKELMGTEGEPEKLEERAIFCYKQCDNVSPFFMTYNDVNLKVTIIIG